MGPQSVRVYVASVHHRYRAPSRTEKTWLLDELCQVAGRHRKSGIRRLGQAPRAPRGRRADGHAGLTVLRTRVFINSSWEIRYTNGVGARPAYQGKGREANAEQRVVDTTVRRHRGTGG